MQRRGIRNDAAPLLHFPSNSKNLAGPALEWARFLNFPDRQDADDLPKPSRNYAARVPRNCAGRCRAQLRGTVPRPATLSPRPRPQTPDGRQMAPNRVGFIVVSVSSGFRESLTAPSSRFPRRAATIFMEPNTRNRRLRRERHPRQRTHEIPREMRRAVDF